MSLSQPPIQKLFIGKTVALADASLTGLTLPGSWQVQGVQVDNPSGSWLTVTAGGIWYVPPYTLGWAQLIAPALTTVDVRYVAVGPAAVNISTQRGSPAQVTLASYPLVSSPGVASVDSLVTPAVLPAAITTNTAASVILPSVAGSRYRVFAFELTYDDPGSAASQSPCFGYLSGGVAGVMAYTSISRASPIDHGVLGQPFDFAPGEAISTQILDLYGFGFLVLVRVTYALL